MTIRVIRGSSASFGLGPFFTSESSVFHPVSPADSISPLEIPKRWLLALGCFALLIFFFSPPWAAFRAWSRVPELQNLLEVRRGASVLYQVDHLGDAIPDRLHQAIQWRLLFPTLARILSLPAIALFGLADVGCVLVCAFVITILRRRQIPWTETTLITIVLGATSWFFTSVCWLGYYDSWLALALLIVAFARTRWSVWAACVWAPWVDERFIVAAPLAFLCRWMALRTDEKSKTLTSNWKTELVVPSLLLVSYLGVRFGLLGSHSAAGATPGGYLLGRNFLNAPLSRIAFGVWGGLRSAWLFVIAAVVLVGGVQRIWSWLLGVAIVLVALIGLATAQDYSRSMTMLIPVALLVALTAFRTHARWLPWVLGGSAFAALLLPAHHVMNDGVNPIFYLYRELAAFENPPAIIMPEIYELAAIHAMEHGDFAVAEQDLTFAIKLSDNPASPAKQRGILAASQHRWADAKRDFSMYVQYDPQNPDARFMRAQASLALGDATAARSDVDIALKLAPEGWTSRPDVARFLNKLSPSVRP